MWINDADTFELFKYLPFYLFIALPIFVIVSPVKPAHGSHEFTVFRMQQYDLHAVPHGCRSSHVNLEGRSLSSWSTSRHCVVARIQDITVEQYMEIRNKAGALLLVLPKNITMLSQDEKDHIKQLEGAMSHQEINIPVYFLQWTEDTETILDDLQHSFITDEKSGTALEAMMNSASANGYQIVATAATPSKLESKVITYHSKLYGQASKPQTIIISAHYDASAIAPELAFGADSNASGAIVLLELARIFSRLYSSAQTRGSHNLLFLLSGVGHRLNYFSIKKWLEDQIDSSDSSLLQDISFAMCLEALSSDSEISVHVSKPPKSGTQVSSIVNRLTKNHLHKKINLADEVLAWSHERFSIKRMSAFTVSTLKSHKDQHRSSILDVPSSESLNNLVKNTQNIARALASHIYNLTGEDNIEEDRILYDNMLNVDKAFIKEWYNYLTSQPRAAQFITTNKEPAGVNAALYRALTRYLGDVIVWKQTVDPREPEIMLYTPTTATLNLYSVKPAIFDLILSLMIASYLGVVYLAILYFPNFYDEIIKLNGSKSKVQ